MTYTQKVSCEQYEASIGIGFSIVGLQKTGSLAHDKKADKSEHDSYGNIQLLQLEQLFYSVMTDKLHRESVRAEPVLPGRGIPGQRRWRAILESEAIQA
jgi:hypothetical protein